MPPRKGELRLPTGKITQVTVAERTDQEFINRDDATPGGDK
jgi:hypothetical protein